SAAAIEAAGLHPALRGHIHQPALEVCPNGDLLAVYFTASTPDPVSTESWPNNALIAVRWRSGSEAWDMPDLFYDVPDVGDVSALLWNDRGTLHLFLGSYDLAGIAFRWTSSSDSGATWRATRLMVPSGPVGHFDHLISTAFRDSAGT